MVHIDGNDFLTNIFIEIIRRGRIKLSISELINLEYYYLECLGEGFILENSFNNIMEFINMYEGYLNYDEENKIISISNEEELLEILFSNSQNQDKYYKSSMKKLINKEKRRKKICA